MNIYLIIFIIILLIMLVALYYAGNYFYNYAIKRNKKSFLQNDPNLKDPTEEATAKSDKVIAREKRHAERAAWFSTTIHEDLYITSRDGLKLRAIFITGTIHPENTIILSHGYISTAETMLTLAKYYQDTFGYSVLLPDARGHGKSEGNYIGMGWPERLDYLEWIDHLNTNYSENTHNIALHGISMGGATVMNISGEKLPENVRFIIEDCGYTSVQGIFTHQLKEMFNLPPFPLLTITSLLTKIRAGYSFKEASSLKQVAKAKVPMLFVHGAQDTFVPFEMVYPLYETATCPKELVIIEEAGHGTAFTLDNANIYKKYISSYVDTYFKS